MFKKSNVINHWFLHRSYDLFFRLLHFKQLALNFWLSSKYFPPTAAEAEAVVLWREMQCNARQTTFGLLNCFIMSGFCCYWAYWLIWENCKKWVEKKNRVKFDSIHPIKQSEEIPLKFHKFWEIQMICESQFTLPIHLLPTCCWRQYQETMKETPSKWETITLTLVSRNKNSSLINN